MIKSYTSSAPATGGSGGIGNVVGPGSATDGHLAVFDGTTGKLIKDGGAVPSGGIGGSTGATDNRLLRSDGTGGSTLQNSAIGCDDAGALTNVTTINGVKVYRALLTQTGTDAPVATVLENTLGEVPAYTADSEAPVVFHLLTESNVFTANKTFIRIGQPSISDGSQFVYAYGARNSATQIDIFTGGGFVNGGEADTVTKPNVLADTPIEILVYP